MSEGGSKKTYRYTKMIFLAVGVFMLLFFGYIYYQRAESEMMLLVGFMGCIALYLVLGYMQKKAVKS